MLRQVVLTGDEMAHLGRLGHRIRLARLRRNLSQGEVAERAGVARKTIAALESGQGTVGLAVLAKTLAILGYPERVANVLESDPLGEELEETHGRKRAGARAQVAEF